MQFFRVKPYQTYIEFYEDSNIVKRSFTEGQVFSADESQLNRRQLDRIEECDPPEEEKDVEENNEKPYGKEGSGNESAKPQGSEQGKADGVDSREAAQAKLRGKKAQSAAQSEESNPHDPDSGTF